MPRIYRDVKPPETKVVTPVKETKTASTTKEKTTKETGKKENGGE